MYLSYLIAASSCTHVAVHRATEATAPSHKRLQHDIPILLWRKGCNKVARHGSFCPPEKPFQLPLVGALASARVCVYLV